ncbi:MAG: hypothetical protein BGO55_17120 [Sphingobacteriales bacterium 50-39]|nr:DUF2520 domain-containing protein [Sphingobacteriales bacterium]OJW60237.1 MAG: hypothetical protein BGO55_17120 [Sphingobacteriales bacterium 50-39]
MQIVIIGSGNVATVLGGKLQEAGHRIVQVFSRRPEHAMRLANELQCGHVSKLANIYNAADLYIAALSDDALRTLGSQISLPGKLIVHTSGATPKEVLLKVSANSGVLYPLQSLRKELRPYPEIPILVDANLPEDLERIAVVARSISGQVQTADNDTRLKLHVAAVLVNNFTNHLYVLAEEYCRKEGADFNMLLPLIRETADRLSRIPPRDAQTGPAIRGDAATIKRHLELIGSYKDIKEVYTLITRQIQSER